MNIKKGDNVIVVSGKDKGKTGKVLRAFPREDRIVVEGVNVLKRHDRPKQASKKGQVVSVPSPIHVSNAMLVDSKTGKRTRLGKKEVGGKLVRVSRKSGTEI